MSACQICDTPLAAPDEIADAPEGVVIENRRTHAVQLVCDICLGLFDDSWVAA